AAPDRVGHRSAARDPEAGAAAVVGGSGVAADHHPHRADAQRSGPRGLSLLRELVARTQGLQAALVAHARASSLALLGEAALPAQAAAAARASDLLEPLLPELLAIAATVPPSDGAEPSVAAPALDELPGAPVQVLRGPLQIRLDPIFEPAFSLLDPRELAAMD